MVRFSQPNISGRILENDGFMNFEEGEFFGEFNHHLSDIINGQISAVNPLWRPHAPIGFQISCGQITEEFRPLPIPIM